MRPSIERPRPVRSIANAAARRKSRLTLKFNAATGGVAVQTSGRVVKTTSKAQAAKAAKARIAAGKANKAKGAQTAAGKARAAVSKTARAEAAAAASAASTAEAPKTAGQGHDREGGRDEADDEEGTGQGAPPRRPRPRRRPRRLPRRRQPPRADPALEHRTRPAPDLVRGVVMSGRVDASALTPGRPAIRLPACCTVPQPRAADRVWLLAGPVVFALGVVLGYVSNELIWIGPIDRATFGWAVVVPMCLVGAGHLRAGRAMDRRTRGARREPDRGDADRHLLHLGARDEHRSDRLRAGRPGGGRRPGGPGRCRRRPDVRGRPAPFGAGTGGPCTDFVAGLTVTLPGASIDASPQITSILFFFIRLPTPPVIWSTTRALWPCTPVQSTRRCRPRP